MTAKQFLQYFTLGIGILELISKETPTDVDDSVVAGVKRALEELNRVRNLPVTKKQLDDLKITVPWQ